MKCTRKGKGKGTDSLPPAIAFDTETTGVHPNQGDKMFAFSTCDTQGEAQAYRIDGAEIRREKHVRRLNRLWDSRNALVMHNAKFDIQFSENILGKRFRDKRVHCTHKMSHVLQNHHHNHGLESLAWDLAEYPKVDADIRAMAKECGGYQFIPKRYMDEYQKHDVVRTQLLYQFFYPKILADERLNEIYETEIELIQTTIDMERRGLMLHVPRTERMIDSFNEKIETAREQLFEHVGRRFKWSSDDEIRKILFDEYGFEPVKLTGKSRKPSVDKHSLALLREQSKKESSTGNPDPFFDLLLQLRSYSKGVKMFLDYIELSDVDGVIHPEINTCAAITSRESCSFPNLQNVQKTGVLLNPFPVPARHAFRPRPGYVNLHIDYSGVEMRLLIHYSDDEAMVDCLNNGDGDVHSLAAIEFYRDRFSSLGKKDPMRKTLRGSSKNCNFAIPYGANVLKVAGTLGMDRTAGAMAFQRYRRKFPRLVNLTRTISREVQDRGGVETTFGRFLHVPREKAYMGTNYKIQGTAAGILKRAQNRVHRFNRFECSNEPRLLLPIHDEIVVEYPRSRLRDLPDYLRQVRNIMIDFPGLFKVPLDVEAEIVTFSWEYKKKIEIPQ